MALPRALRMEWGSLSMKRELAYDLIIGHISPSIPASIDRHPQNLKDYPKLAATRTEIG